MAVMTVERPLREKLGDDGTNALVKLFDKFEENIKAEVINLSEDKYERRLTEEIANIRIDMGLHKSELKGDTAGLRAELKEDMAKLRSEFKQDMAELRSEFKQDMAELKSELKQDMAELKSELKQDMAGLRTELSGKISSSYASLIKWMFIFWLGQIGAILGILFAFFKS